MILDESVNLDSCTTFEVFLNADMTKLVVTQYYQQENYPERGSTGIYYYERIDDIWRRIKRLPIPYAWGVNVTPDNKLLFVNEGKIQSIDLHQIGLQW